MTDLEKARQKINEVDTQMRELFLERMAAVKEVAEYKKQNGIAIFDDARESEVIARNMAKLNNNELKPYYLDFVTHNMQLSKQYQHEKINKGIISVKTSVSQYDIVVKRGVLNNLKEYLNLERKVLIVTDSGVPENYSKTVAAQCKEGYIYTFTQGEESKNFNTTQAILEQMVKNGFTRSDCVVAVGGGVVGDMSGFAAASFMRGVDFYNIPTTVLSQVDSSIGGKVAIDFCGVKNIVGAFYPPKAVIIDADTLKTLPKRQISNGLAEALKMAATFDEKLFNHFINDDLDIDYIIEQSLQLKKAVVEEDEKEQGKRRVLNFGHTIGHAIESVNLGRLYHGECVGLGMLYCCSDDVKLKIKAALKKLNLPIECEINADEIIDFMAHDKKKTGDSISVIWVNEIGSYETRKMTLSELKEVILK